MYRRALHLLAVVALLTGCGNITIDADDVEGFSPSSQIWQVQTTSGANRHSFVLTNLSGYCSKQKLAEQDRIDATARHAARLEDGDPVCESTDLFYDDLADAASALERDGAAFLRIAVDRQDESSIDAITAPESGEYRQVGAGDDKFTAQYVRLNGKVSQQRAEAYNCLDPEELDETNWQEFLAEVEPGLVDFWELDAGILDLSESGSDAWSVDVEGDLLEGGSTVGSLEASFVGKRCEVPATSDEIAP